MGALSPPPNRGIALLIRICFIPFFHPKTLSSTKLGAAVLSAFRDLSFESMMWGLTPSSSAALNPKFREVYTCVHGPNGPEYALQAVPHLAPEGSWGAPHWGAPQGPLTGEATGAGAPWGGACTKEEELSLSLQTSVCSSACASDFGVSISSSTEGGPLGGPASPGHGEPHICGVKRRLELGEAPKMKQQRVCDMWHVA